MPAVVALHRKQLPVERVEHGDARPLHGRLAALSANGAPNVLRGGPMHGHEPEGRRSDYKRPQSCPNAQEATGRVRRRQPLVCVHCVHAMYPNNPAYGLVVRGGCKSGKYTTPGVANVAPTVPAEDASKINAVSTEPACCDPKIGSASVVPAVPPCRV